MRYLTLPACLLAGLSICSAQEPAPAAPEHTAVIETPEHAVAARPYDAVLQQVTDQSAILKANTSRIDQVLGASKEVKKARSKEERKSIDIEMRRLMVDMPKQIELAKKLGLELLRAGDQLHSVDKCLALFTSTIDKKVGDLSVRDSDEILVCRKLGLYPPAKQ